MTRPSDKLTRPLSKNKNAVAPPTPEIHELSDEVGRGGVYRVALAGVGGNGGQMVTHLGKIDRCLRALELGRIDLDIYDADVVSPANVGRTPFFDSEVGQNKALAITHRANLTFGVQWQGFAENFGSQKCKSAVGHVTSESAYDFLITAVDSGEARRAIQKEFEGDFQPPHYWLDMGNEARTGQVLLGQCPGIFRSHKGARRLPTVVEKWPNFFDGTVPESNLPSCGVADALLKQSLFINTHVSAWAAEFLWTLLSTKKAEFCGCFISLKDGRVQSLRVETVPDQRSVSLDDMDGDGFADALQAAGITAVGVVPDAVPARGGV